VYSRIDDMTNRWEGLQAEPGERAASERAALESAIGREVFRDMDATLRDATDGDNPRHRHAALRGLGFIRDPRSLVPLEAALHSPDVRDVVAAQVSIARIAPVELSLEGEQRIVSLLNFPDREVRSNAALVLARVFRARQRLSLAAVEPADRREDVAAALMACLFDPEDSFVRGNAARALGVLGGEGVEDALQNGLRDRDLFARTCSAHALARAGSLRSVAPLVDALSRAKEPPLQQALVLAMGAIAERDGLTPPMEELKDDAAAWRKWFTNAGSLPR
jgi:HEAT repeat protein